MIFACSACAAKNRVPVGRLHERSHCGGCKALLTPLVKPLPLHHASDVDDLVVGALVPVVIDFWADWCGPCLAIAPQIEQLARNLAGSIVVAKVDTEELPDIARRFGIRSIPTLVLFSGGHEQRRISGAMPADAIARGLHL